MHYKKTFPVLLAVLDSFWQTDQSASNDDAVQFPHLLSQMTTTMFPSGYQECASRRMRANVGEKCTRKALMERNMRRGTGREHDKIVCVVKISSQPSESTAGERKKRLTTCTLILICLNLHSISLVYQSECSHWLSLASRTTDSASKFMA